MRHRSPLVFIAVSAALTLCAGRASACHPNAQGVYEGCTETQQADIKKNNPGVKFAVPETVQQTNNAEKNQNTNGGGKKSPAAGKGSSGSDEVTAGDMLTADEALRLLKERQERWSEQYGVQMNGKYNVVIRSASDDVRAWLTQRDGKISRQDLRKGLVLLESQIGEAYFTEVPGLTDEQRRARLDDIEQRKNQAHTGISDELMQVVHKAVEDGVKDAQNQPPPPPKPGTDPNGSQPNGGASFPGGGLPSSGMIDDMLKSGPNNPDNWVWSAKDKLAKGDKAAGLAALDNAIAAGGNADAFALRGAIKEGEGDYAGAYADAKRALEFSPGDKNILGLLHSLEGRVGATDFSGSGGAGGSGGGDSGGAGGGSAGYGGGFASGGFGSPRDSGVAGMTSSSAISSNQKLNEAKAAFMMNDFARALSLAQRALELNPGNAAAHNLIAMIQARLKNYPQAIASASAGLALAPGNGPLLNSKANAEIRSKKYRDALATANLAIEANPRDAQPYAYRGVANAGLGDRAAALADLERAASMDPRFKKAAEGALQLPSAEDILFLFPGETPSESAAPAAPARGRSFGVVVGAGILGGLLLAFGLLSTVLAPLKDSAVAAFTRVTRRGPTLHALEQPVQATIEPASVGGMAAALIRGQYEITRQIGAGGMGLVFEGTDRSLGRRVAIKKMRDELRLNARERERFVIEAKTVAALHHPNIVDIYAIAEEGEDVYLVFEFVDGKTVHDFVQARGRLSPADTVRISKAVAEALAYAHSRGVIHRDVKPSNVMLNPSGLIKVMDFGIARMAKDALTRHSMTNTVVGTPPYMAPEQEQGVVRKESDVYSLAICSYEMLTGKLPFIGQGAGMLLNKINMSFVPPSRAIAGLPAALDEVFAKAFQTDPDRRYRTPQEFASALEGAAGGVRGQV